eukprot:TRINITY_DN19330_c0_g1_i1.p1 TRINITY_DN19330_c0_g1~~TRINITY_DN19330_c0_g1_i1.p1  ORF type:complete len:520 (+),score=41.06 TRINITY_DN19330_c0_g1_i1:33-1592(+)
MHLLISFFAILGLLQVVHSVTCPAASTCNQDSQCNTNNICCKGNCVPKVSIGQKCNVTECNGRCGASAACVQGVCKTEFPGCSCTSDADCGGDMICKNSICDFPSSCNPPFGTNPSCSSDQICWDYQCQVGLPLDANCTLSNNPFILGSNCAAGLYCSTTDLHCQTSPKINQTCDTTCGTGLYCDGNKTCAQQLANGSNCTSDGNCQSGICLKTNICSAPLNLGQTCQSSEECASEFCACPGYDGTVTSSNCTFQCLDPYSVAPGSYCSTSRQCQSQICDCVDGGNRTGNLGNCQMAKCIARFSGQVGSICASSQACQTSSCNVGKCVELLSVPVGGACSDANACVFGSTCNGVCTNVPANSACKNDNDCGNGMECQCQGSSPGACRNSTLYQAAMNSLLCVQRKKAWNYTQCYTRAGVLDLKPSCQQAIVDYICCNQCGVDNVYLGTASLILGYSVDCQAGTIAPSNAPSCCGSTSASCWQSTVNCNAFPTGSAIDSSSSNVSWMPFLIISIIAVFSS